MLQPQLQFKVSLYTLIFVNIINYNVIINFLVPQPSVELTTLPESAPFYAGSALSLRCTIAIDSAVDIPYLVTVEWLKSGAVLSASDRVSVSNVTQQTSLVYLASVIVHPLSVTTDNGLYTCRAIVDTNPLELNVQRAIHLDTESVTVQSKLLMIDERLYILYSQL